MLGRQLHVAVSALLPPNPTNPNQGKRPRIRSDVDNVSAWYALNVLGGKVTEKQVRLDKYLLKRDTLGTLGALGPLVPLG